MEKTKNMKKDTQPKKEKKKITKDLEVVIMNNTNSKIFYRCPKTSSIIEMQEFGDTETLTIEQLNAMKNSHKAMLEKFWIVLVDVMDEEISLEEVLEYLRIKKLYNGFIFSADALDELIKDSTYEEFQCEIKKMKNSLVLIIAQRMKVLNKEGEFGDSYKMNFLADYMGSPTIFTED